MIVNISPTPSNTASNTPTNTNSGTPCPTETTTPSITATQTQTTTNTITPTNTPTSNPVCPNQMEINKVTGAWSYPNLTYNRLTSYIGGTFTGGYYYFDGVSITFITGATPSGITYSVYEAQSGSTYYTLLSYTTNLTNYAWRVFEANGGSIIDGAGFISTTILNTNAVLNSITTGGITYPKPGIQNIGWATVIYPSICPTLTPTATPTITSTQTNTPSITATQTNTPSITATQTQTSTPTSTPPVITPTNTETTTNTPTQTNTDTPTSTPTNTSTPTASPEITPSMTQTNTSTATPTNTPTITIETCAFLTVRTDASLDVPITGVEVNSVPVSYLSGTTFTIDPSDSPGYFNTTQTGSSVSVVVNYGSNIAGQRIEIVDCNSNTLCCDLNPGGGTCTFTGVDLSCNCNWEIQAYDGTCPPPPATPSSTPAPTSTITPTPSTTPPPSCMCYYTFNSGATTGSYSYVKCSDGTTITASIAPTVIEYYCVRDGYVPTIVSGNMSIDLCGNPCYDDIDCLSCL